MKRILTIGLILAFFVAIPLVSSVAPDDLVNDACAIGDIYADLPALTYCETNYTLYEEYCTQIQACNDTDTIGINCSKINRIYCLNGCNNQTYKCEMFKGEEENFNKIAFYGLSIIVIGIFILILLAMIKRHAGGRRK